MGITNYYIVTRFAILFQIAKESFELKDTSDTKMSVPSMMSKGLLLARPVGNLIQRRGKAVQSWKRPTMDEYLGPKSLGKRLMPSAKRKDGPISLGVLPL